MVNCRGNIRAVIRYAYEREKGGVLIPEDIDEKSGDLVVDTLKAKHSEAKDVLVNKTIDVLVKKTINV